MDESSASQVLLVASLGTARQARRFCIEAALVILFFLVSSAGVR